MRRRAGLALAVALLVGPAGTAAAVPAPSEEPTPPAERLDLEEMNDALIEANAELLPGMGGELPALGVLSALEYGRPVRARELAEALLAEDPSSPAAHFALGSVLQEAEGNHARALYHYERALALFEERYGAPDEHDPWWWHQRALERAAYSSISMGRHDRALEFVDRLEASYTGRWRDLRDWPLALSGRHSEAEALAQEMLADSSDPGVRASAWTTLCALRGEARDAEGSYAACMAALEEERSAADRIDPIRQTNAAEAALGVLHMDEAERLLLDATDNFVRGSLASPWGDLVLLYVEQGRTGEAVAALREMVAWREAQSPEVRVHIWTSQDLAAATLLVAAGRPLEATRLTQRALERPDRDGLHSAASADLASTVALLDHAANRAAAEVRAEEAAAAPFPQSVVKWLDSLRYRLRAWLSGRRALALFADASLLSSRLQPHPGGFARLAEWVDPDLVSLLGPGVVAAALEEARADGLVDDENGYAQVFEAEIAWQRGRMAEARFHAETARARLPRREVLLRARAEAIGADAALRDGDVAGALDGFDRVFQLDAGALRRQGVSLPCRIEASGGAVAEEARKRLRRSPRFHASADGFTIRIEGDDRAGSACLEGARGTLHACASGTLRAGESPEDLGRRLALALQRETFAPRVDLTQADLRSLDGTPINASDEGADRLRIVLSELTGSEDDAAEE